jgi:serine/threonine protein kinase
MPDVTDELELRFARLVEHHILHDAMPAIEEMAADRPDLITPLRGLAAQYLALSTTLDFGAGPDGSAGELASRPDASGQLPSFPGFRTIQRLGAGGMGEVYKLQDLKLDRFVAGKVVRTGRLSANLADFLREARSMALFKDRRIVQIFEFRADATPPVIIMEYVEGFELGRVGPSLEFSQRARIVREICEAIQHAHGLGIQHRDLKPSNIMLDGSLAPKILDFGLSTGDPSTGHLQGTLAYIAPEQLDPSQPIDARTDVYALGVILYELLCGTTPFAGRDTMEVIQAIREVPVRLPIEVEARVPEPLQAIALKAMERRPADRYASAREMALDLTRYLEGRPVLARPTQYASTLDARVQPHLNQIAEWVRLKLIYPHEADRIQSAYGGLAAREDDWIASSRALSYSQIALYFGAFLLLAGSLFYFGADRLFGNVKGLLGPILVLAVPFAGLNIAGRYLYRTERRAVAVAFFLAGVSLLPLFLLIWFHEAGILVAAADAPNQLFDGGSVSNRQLQVTILVACLWSGWLAFRTRTSALSTVFTLLAFLLAVALMADAGLRSWVDEGHYDRIALHLWPLAAGYAGLGLALERTGRPWFVTPLYIATALVLVGVLDLLAIDGKTFWYLGGFSLQPFQPKHVSSQTLIDTVTTLSLNGMAFYAVGSLMSRRALMKVSATLLFVIAPFSTLEPIAYLVQTKEYALRFDWLYLALAATTAIISHHRQRKSFYYAGVINSGFALYWVAEHRHWLEKPGWAIALVAVGLVVLGGGFVLDARERKKKDVP